MAFTFPSGDGKHLTYGSPDSSNYSYFTEQAIRAGYTIPDDSRQAEVQRPNIEASESVEREIMKQRIRAEIMAEEMARRRVLEEEIRMELMLEREMALHRLDTSRMRFDSYSGGPQFGHESSGIPQPVGHLEERRPALLPMMPIHREPGFPGLESSPFQRHPMATPPEPRKETILLAKPETNISGLKRKAPTPVSDHHKASYTGLESKPKLSMGLEKKPRGNAGLGKKPKGNIDLEKKPKEWKCELCDIRTTSEIALSEHMHGKKHKAIEEGLGSHRIGFGTGPATNKSSVGTNKLDKALENTSSPNVNKARKAYGKSSENARSEATTVENKGNSKWKKHDKADSTSNSKAKASYSIENGKPGNPTTPNSVGPAKKFRFWCEMCQVGAFSPKVFSSHETGKRHLAMLEELNTASKKH